MSKVKKKLDQKLRNFVEKNRHIFEVTLDFLHFFVLPPFLIWYSYYLYWLWNTDFVDHKEYVDIQFSLRGNTVSVDKNLNHDEKYYWLFEVDWPNRLIDYYQLDKEYRVFKRQSRYIYRYERPDLICKNWEGRRLIYHNLNAKSLFVKFRNHFYREYCQNVDHLIRQISKENDNSKNFIESRKLKIINNIFNNQEINFKESNFNTVDYIKSRPLYINDTYFEYKRCIYNELESWKYKRSIYSKMLGQEYSKDLRYRIWNLRYRKEVPESICILVSDKVKINDLVNENFFLKKNLKKYSKLEKLKMSYKGENFLAPFDSEIKRLEDRKKIAEYKLYEKRKKKAEFYMLEFLSNNKNSLLDQYYLCNLDFKTKQKLLMESRLRNRVCQRTLYDWSLGRRVPYKFKHDNLLDNKMFKTRSHYYDVYKQINRKRKTNTNALSISNWANNYRTRLKNIYLWDKIRDMYSLERVYRRRKWRVVRENYNLYNNWINNRIYRRSDWRWFIHDHISKKRRIKTVSPFYNHRFVYNYKLNRIVVNMNTHLYTYPCRRWIFENNELYVKGDFKNINCGKRFIYDSWFMEGVIYNPLQAFTLPLSEEDAEKNRIEDKIRIYRNYINPDCRKIKVLKTESVYIKDYSNRKDYITKYPLRAKQNVDIKYRRRRIYE